MAVPFIDLKRFEDGFLDSWFSKVKSMTENTQFVGGAEVQNLEQRLSKECEVGHTIACANGTDALQLALRALDVGPGDIVIIPDSTFWATFEAVVNVGASPVTVDINPDDLQMDFALFKEGISKFKPKAAILVHLYGWASPFTNEIRQYCKEQGVHLIEDGAQSYGVKIDGESIYKGALISTVSFYPAKVLGAAGDGGAVFTNDANLAEKVRSLGNHGREAHYAHGYVGWNSRMDSFQAAFLNFSLDHIQARLDSRIKSAKFFQESVPEARKGPKGNTENGYLNVCIFKPQKREELIQVLQQKSIGYGIVYPAPMSSQKGAQPYIKGRVGGERTELHCKSVLNLPLFPYMKQEELEEVLSALK